MRGTMALQTYCPASACVTDFRYSWLLLLSTLGGGKAGGSGGPAGGGHGPSSSPYAPSRLSTMLDSFLVQVRVSGGLPDHMQVSVTSEPMSVTVGLGATMMRGATGGERGGLGNGVGGLGGVGGAAPLTVHVHQRADVGAADVVVHLAGHGLREEGVVHLRVVLVLLGLLDDHPPFGPPGGSGDPGFSTPLAPRTEPGGRGEPPQRVPGSSSPVAFDLGVGGGHAGEDDPLALLHRLGLDGQGDSRGICGKADGAVAAAGAGSAWQRERRGRGEKPPGPAQRSRPRVLGTARGESPETAMVFWGAQHP